MAFKCLECGHIFEEGEQKTYVETHGISEPPFEEFSVCPVCNGFFQKAVRCKVCGGFFLKDELNYDGTCEDCFNSDEEVIKMTIGERIKAFRVKNLLTVRKAAEIFGVSSGEITRLESNKNKNHFITTAKWEEKLEKAEKEII